MQPGTETTPTAPIKPSNYPWWITVFSFVGLGAMIVTFAHLGKTAPTTHRRRRRR